MRHSTRQKGKIFHVTYAFQCREQKNQMKFVAVWTTSGDIILFERWTIFHNMFYRKIINCFILFINKIYTPDVIYEITLKESEKRWKFEIHNYRLLVWTIKNFYLLWNPSTCEKFCTSKWTFELHVDLNGYWSCFSFEFLRNVSVHS